MQTKFLGPALFVCAALAACAEDSAAPKPCDGVAGHCVAIAAGATYETVQAAFINAKSGDTLAFSEGRYHFTKGLSLLDADGVTVKGLGIDKTVISFKGSADADGFYVTGDRFTMHDLTVEDAPKNNTKNEGADGVTYRRVKSQWTGGPKTTNGAYAFYPVQCKNVLIEDSLAIGSADAGIYVGQSENIVVRRNVAEYNVAGIEIENSVQADVYENVARHNAGGILAFSLPTLQVKAARDIRVFDNDVYANDTNNFATKTSIVADVPTGTGIMVFAAGNVEIFGNTLRDNGALSFLVVSYLTAGIDYDDPGYDPFPRRVHIHDNVIVSGGDQPGGTAPGSEKRNGDLLLLAVAGQLGKETIPAIVWDGYTPDATTTPDQILCFHDNTNQSFVNIDYPGDLSAVDYSEKPHACTFPAVAATDILGVK